MLESGWEKKIWLEICQNKIINSKDIRELLRRYSIDKEELDTRRWVTDMASIIAFNNHYYRIYWSRGNTENQEDEISGQILEEVEKKVIIKEVVEWVAKG